ncbi:MAG: hypothetical protein U1E70_10030 [Acetobacteraceae bacterium]|nr:hypothetical protein [Pseudomonadota bacterium]
MRTVLYAALLSLAATATALADASVAGAWKADVGSDVVINMSITPDGAWRSETRQQDKVVRQMKGTYKQTKAAEDSGTLVFTPTQAKVSSGKVMTETDRYVLSENGAKLSLTANGDTMVFEKQAGR